MALTCASLLETYPEVWKNAIEHPFLQECQAGTIQPAQFNTWLVQDYLFALECTRMVARLLSLSPPDHFNVLLGGLGAIKDEIQWFRENAAKRQLVLGTPPQPTCREYCHLMASAGHQPYAVQALAFWAIEAAYNQAWKGHSPMPEPYTEFGDRWGNPNFSAYVEELARQADEALALADKTQQQAAEAIFLDIARLEQNFWQMAYQGDGASQLRDLQS